MPDTSAPGATVVSATVGDGATIGMGAHVLPGAVIGKFAYIDANAVVEAGTVVPEGEVRLSRSLARSVCVLAALAPHAVRVRRAAVDRCSRPQAARVVG